MIVIATQVIEAGIDIDMDIGFKSISKLDSEEQLIGQLLTNLDKAITLHQRKLEKLQDIKKAYLNEMFI